jgi:alpha-D-xyloside xylohydrolase
LTIGDRKGKFAGVLKERVFKIVFVTENLGNGIYIGDKFKMKKYSGKKTLLRNKSSFN